MKTGRLVGLVGLAGLALAAFLALSPEAPAEARSPQPPAEPGECQACHFATQQAWEKSAHTQGLSCAQCHAMAASLEVSPNHPELEEDGPVCVQCHVTGYDAATQGWQADGVTCAACHGPLADNHPQQAMPTNRAESLCGNCHLKTAGEWASSRHGQNELACVTCHDPHTGGLRTESVSTLCLTCHATAAENALHARHAGVVGQHGQASLSCADCHLGALLAPAVDGRWARDHSFQVQMEVCGACHADQLHGQSAPAQSEVEANPGVLQAGAPAREATSSQGGDLGKIILAGLVGLGIGLSAAYGRRALRGV